MDFIDFVKRTVIKRWFDYAVLAIAFYFSLMFFNSFLEIEGFQYLTTQMRRMADAMLFALPVFFLYKKKFLFPYIFLVLMYILTNIWYYRNYGTLMPLSSYLMFENLNGLGPSIINSMRWKDLWIVFPVAFYMFYYTMLEKWKSKEKFDWKRFLVAIIMIAGIISPSYILHSVESPEHPYNILKIEIIRGYRQLGFFNYWVYQIRFTGSCTDEEKLYAENYMMQLNSNNNESFEFTSNDKKNLILIMVESLQSWPINLNIDGVEVTPFLNSLVKNDSVLFFSKVLPQVKGGRSSDAQLLVNTGLLPIREGSTASLFGTNVYIGLPHLLKEMGYSSYSFICEDKSFWNQEATSQSYGFDKLYDNLGKKYGYRADEHMFKSAIEIIKEKEMPFYAQLVTLSGHDIVETDFESELRKKSFISNEIKNDLIITEYVDKCIKNFINDLKLNNMYDNSIIVITGDHFFITYDKFEGREKCELSDRYVPFIVINSPLMTETDNVIGQSDIFPSILDIMGVESDYRGLGESVFRKQWDCAVYHTGEVADSCSNDSVIKAKKELWNVSDILIRMNYFKN